MLARLDTAVIRGKPDLVLWQLGTNSVLDGKAVQPQASRLREGLARLKATGADVVLIDPQYVPKVIAKRHADEMVSLIATAAKEERVDHFRRFDLMRHWHETEHGIQLLYIFVTNRYDVLFIEGIGITIASLHLHQQHARQSERREELLQLLEEAEFL